MKFNPNETRLFYCYGPAASGKTTFARELSEQAKNPIWLSSESQLTARRPFTKDTPYLDGHDLVVLDDVVATVTEDGFNTMLNHPIPKTYVICSQSTNEFIPEDDRVTILEFPRK